MKNVEVLREQWMWHRETRSIWLWVFTASGVTLGAILYQPFGPLGLAVGFLPFFLTCAIVGPVYGWVARRMRALSESVAGEEGDMAEGLANIVFLVSLINYRIDDRYVRCYWGPVPVRKIAIDDIRDAVKGSRHMSESWTNTIWMPSIRKRGAILYRRTGGLKRVIITPDDPEGFIERIKAHERFFFTP